MKAKKRSCARGLSLGGGRRFEHAAARTFAQTPFQSELTPKFSIIINAKAASGRVILSHDALGITTLNRD
jgi:hypothetical protein